MREDDGTRAAGGGLDVHDGVAPLADLLFAVATIIIALLVVVLPSMVTVRAAAVDREGLLEAVSERTGSPVILLAAADGLTVVDRRTSPATETPIATAALLDSPALAALLADVATGPAPTLVIEDDGSEAAFVLEGLMARAGLPIIRQLRVPSIEGAGS